MDADELAGWLLIATAPGLGRSAARRLLRAFGSAQAVRAAPAAAQREVAGEAAALALARAGATLAERLETTRRWLAAPGTARDLVALGDPRYPALLLETADPPLLLHAEGRLDLLQSPSLAVVGSRNPTVQGALNARAFAAALAQAGWTVVSGLALGVDGAAHEGALPHPAGTVAVVGTGLDRVYPRRHQALAARIAVHGLLLSEYALGTPALAAHFPQRNRLIAGLTHGTLVVEAALHSGSLITARLAADGGRDVFAVPGSIHSPLSRGCHALIKQGAKLVDDASDILEELALPPGAAAAARAVETPSDRAPKTEPAAPAPDGETRHPPGVGDARLLEALGYDPVPLDTLLARTGAPAREVAARLLALELDGQVARLPGQRFQRLGGG